MEEKFFGGSRAFFEGLESFYPHDTDYIVLSDKVTKENHYIMIRGLGETTFKWCSTLTKEELFEFLLGENVPPTDICTILVPGFAKHYSVEIDDLKQFQKKAESLDKNHLYLGIILNAYIKNGRFELNEEQLKSAFELYNSVR